MRRHFISPPKYADAYVAVPGYKAHRFALYVQCDWTHVLSMYEVACCTTRESAEAAARLLCPEEE